MIDVELAATISYIRLAERTMEHRKKKLAGLTTKLSRHYNKVQHTDAVLEYLASLQELLKSDPDYWDEVEEDLPF